MIPSDNDALLSRVSKAADGTDIAEMKMVLCQVESVLMGDPLVTASDASREALIEQCAEIAKAYGREHNTATHHHEYHSGLSDAASDIADRIAALSLDNGGGDRAK